MQPQRQQEKCAAFFYPAPYWLSQPMPVTAAAATPHPVYLPVQAPWPVQGWPGWAPAFFPALPGFAVYGFYRCGYKSQFARRACRWQQYPYLV